MPYLDRATNINNKIKVKSKEEIIGQFTQNIIRKYELKKKFRANIKIIIEKMKKAKLTM